ncbi:chromosomal replication initiator protein DnaA [Patescibacteria group bacterium]|nr:MAG: chromosomal replication initiator protein DnaA [Patescibacteria group bacterium]
MTTHELWHAVLGELELSLSKANFTTWFRNTFIASHAGNEVCIGVPNAFTKAWLEKKYHKEIMNSLQNLTNHTVRIISYRVDSKIPAAAGALVSSPASEPALDHPIQADAMPFQVETSHAQPQNGEFTLNGKYAFATFIVGKQNELAHAAAQAVAAQPGGVYNPLFIYGGVGLGKTHLLQAVGNDLVRKTPSLNVLYVTCERFTNDYIGALRGNQMKEFKSRYRNVDLLLIDDIQFLKGKKETQEEFFHTFNQLYQNNKQIVITSDRPPKAIPELEQRLISRFECGMMADVGSPDFETRVAILWAKCREKNYALDHDILNHVATVVQTNVRELEGALNKVIAFHQFKNIPPTVESVRPILTSFNPTTNKKTLTARQVLTTVATYFDLPVDELLGKSREKRLAFPRQIIMYLLREEMKASYPAIGSELGGRDHTTAMHAYDKILNCLNEDEKLQHDLEIIKQRLYAL